MNTIDCCNYICNRYSDTYKNGTKLGKIESGELDNHFTMSHMNSENQIKSGTNRLKNLLIVFGVCLSLFTITSFNNWGSSTEPIVAQEIQGLENCTSEQPEVNVIHAKFAQNNPTFKTHHNFIVSYLLQDTSFERKNKNSKVQADLLSNLKQLHKIILSQFVVAW